MHRIPAIATCLLLVCAMALAGEIKHDESVIFFPTYASQQKDGRWRVHIHGWIFEREENDPVRLLLLRELSDELELGAEAEADRLFHQRAAMFIVDNERGKKITVRFEADQDIDLEPSNSNGHFSTTVTWEAQHGVEILQPAADPANDRALNQYVQFTAVLQEGDARKMAGHVQFISAKGISVISDIDDTIKISKVSDKRELLLNSFTREYVAVDNMADVYREWQQQGAVFHYVTASPWQMYESISTWMFNDAAFPRGSMHMRHFRWKDDSFFELFQNPAAFKMSIISPILEEFPQRRFILVGDTGESDVTVYGQFARKHPEQIVHIFLRNTTGLQEDAAVLRESFRDVPRDKWTLFSDAGQIESFKLPVTD